MARVACTTGLRIASYIILRGGASRVRVDHLDDMKRGMNGSPVQLKLQSTAEKRLGMVVIQAESMVSIDSREFASRPVMNRRVP